MNSTSKCYLNKIKDQNTLNSNKYSNTMSKSMIIKRMFEIFVDSLTFSKQKFIRRRQIPSRYKTTDFIGQI